jgi:hypothetical protein
MSGLTSLELPLDATDRARQLHATGLGCPADAGGDLRPFAALA